jgi:hypothetical protein
MSKMHKKKIFRKIDFLKRNFTQHLFNEQNILICNILLGTSKKLFSHLSKTGENFPSVITEIFQGVWDRVAPPKKSFFSFLLNFFQLTLFHFFLCSSLALK